MTKREQFINGIHELAKFYQDNPEFPLPNNHSTFDIVIIDKDPKPELARLARLMGKVVKKEYGSFFTLRRKFSDLIYIDVSTYRNRVCDRVVTGTKVIPAQVIAAQPERIIPEQIVEEFEWRCGSILAEEDSIK